MLDTTPLTARLNDLMHTGGSLDDVGKLVTALNGITDFEKKDREAATARKSEIYEVLKTIAVVIVPFLTLLTLAVTIYFQWDQSRITLRANEDSQWRAVADAYTKPPGPTTDVVVTTALLPFYDSERYRDQAYEMTYLLAGRISSESAFRSLFRGAFVHAGWSNAQGMERLSLELAKNFADIDLAYQSLGGEKKMKELSLVPRRSFKPSDGLDIFQASHARDEVLAAEHYLSNEVGQMLRDKRPSSLDYKDFTGFKFFESDLSSTNFDQLDIGGADFQRANLDGAQLTPANFAETNWSGTAWWRVKQVSPAMLQYLLDHAKIDFGGNDRVTLDSTDVVVLQSDYVKQIERLCAGTGINCKARIAAAMSAASSASSPADVASAVNSDRK